MGNDDPAVLGCGAGIGLIMFAAMLGIKPGPVIGVRIRGIKCVDDLSKCQDRHQGEDQKP